MPTPMVPAPMIAKSNGSSAERTRSSESERSMFCYGNLLIVLPIVV